MDVEARAEVAQITPRARQIKRLVSATPTIGPIPKAPVVWVSGPSFNLAKAIHGTVTV